MIKIRDVTKPVPLVVRGDMMIDLLNRVQLTTLQQIRSDLGSMDFTNADVIRTVIAVIDRRKLVNLIEEGDTVSMDPIDHDDFPSTTLH